MPTRKFEFIINGKVQHTCYSNGEVKAYSDLLAFVGCVDYEVIETKITI